MILLDVKIAVIGLGKSGYALINYLEKKGAKVYVYDIKADYEDFEKRGYSQKVKPCLGQNPTGDEDVKLVIVSPGVPMYFDFVRKFKERNIELIGEVEFAYRMAKGIFVGITGTNGKTTTTTLVGEIFKSCGYDTRVVGNIGNPIIDEIETSTDETVFVCELSSFQLETVREFSCHIATIINVTPDHLDRHKTFENYAYFKGRIYNNQTHNDFAIVNYEDKISQELSSLYEHNKLLFSVHNKLDKGIYLNEGKVFYNIDGEEQFLMNRDDISLKGDHNMENVLAAIGISIAYNLELETVKEVIANFKGVEHRLEFVDNINGVDYVNDSKGTNPDASIKAVAAYDNIILIAGGYDKGADFKDYLKLYKEKQRLLIVMGQTSKKIVEQATELGIENILEVESMKDAIRVASKCSVKGDTVLLSPACASWGMYENYEIRGEDFKKEVRALKA